MRERIQAPDIQTAVAARTAIGERPTVLVLDADLVGKRGSKRRTRELFRLAAQQNIPLVINASRPEDVRILPGIPSLVLSGQPNPAYDDLAAQSHVVHFTSTQTETPPLQTQPSVQYVFGARPTTPPQDVETKPATVFPIEGNPIKEALNALHMITAEKPGEPHRGQTNWVRKAEWAYGPIIDMLNPKSKTPTDITIDGMKAVQHAVDAVVNADGPLSPKQRRKIMRQLWLGWGRDVADGIRARRTHNSTREGSLLDLAVDRAQEAYMAIMISLLNFQHAKDQSSPQEREKFIDSLLTATATILPTIAKAQDGMLAVVAPERSPTGGSRIRRIRKLSSALKQAARGNYDKSTDKINRMQQEVIGAFTFRSTPTETYRSDPHDLTSFDITKLDPKEFESPELKPLRDNVATWLQFVWFAQQTAGLVTQTLKESGYDTLVSQYETAVSKQLGKYAEVKVSEIVDTWNLALPNHTFSINEALSPQALIALEASTDHVSLVKKISTWIKENPYGTIPWVMTASRPVLAALGAIAVFENDPGLAEVLFGAGALSDLDGYFARKFNATTKAGAIADPVADALFRIGMLAASAHETPYFTAIVIGLEMYNLRLNAEIQKNRDIPYVPFLAKAGTAVEFGGFEVALDGSRRGSSTELLTGGLIMTAGALARTAAYKTEHIRTKRRAKKSEDDPSLQTASN